MTSSKRPPIAIYFAACGFAVPACWLCRLAYLLLGYIRWGTLVGALAVGCVGLAALAIRAAIGIVRFEEWALTTIRVLGFVFAFFGGILLLMFLHFSRTQRYLGLNFTQKVMWSAAFAVVGTGWLVYFNRDATEALFSTTNGD